MEIELGRATSTRKPSAELVVTRSRLDGALREAAARLGIEQLYPEQERALADVLAGRDVLMVLPTGFGKSACYQIPSMLLKRPVVVVSPLLALLRDQQQKLERREIPCVRLDGTVRGRARREALERIAAGGPLLVMTTPETLESAEAREVLGRTGIGLAAVDEAHCISEWGHDFRPAYSRIGSGLAELGGPPVLALTATATPRVRATIISALGMRDPGIVADSPHRSNLAFEVIRCTGDQRLRALLRLVRRLRRPGIVYCSTRREVEGVQGVLKRFKIPAYGYHGKMPAADRNRQQKRFMRPRHRGVMVATSAFGLGIDKHDIRYILHSQAPASLEQYVQEAGRAGRDGRRANCLMLFDSGDRAIHEALLAKSRIRPDQLFRLGRTLGAWAAEGRKPTVQALAVSAELGPRIVTALLAPMEEAGFVSREDSLVELTVPPDQITENARSLAGKFETLRTQDARRLDALADYARGGDCRASFLRGYFGEDDGEPCGLCDNCQERKARPSAFFAPLPQQQDDRNKQAKKKKKKKSSSRRGKPSGKRRGGRRRRGRGRRGGAGRNRQGPGAEG